MVATILHTREQISEIAFREFQLAARRLGAAHFIGSRKDVVLVQPVDSALVAAMQAAHVWAHNEKHYRAIYSRCYQWIGHQIIMRQLPAVGLAASPVPAVADECGNCGAGLPDSFYAEYGMCATCESLMLDARSAAAAMYGDYDPAANDGDSRDAQTFEAGAEAWNQSKTLY